MSLPRLTTARVGFFAKDQDILLVTDQIENRFAVQFHPLAGQEAPLASFLSARAISDIAIADHSQSAGCQRYLITLTEQPPAFEIQSVGGRPLRVPSYGNSPHAVWFSCGGMWHGDCVIAGEFSMWSDGEVTEARRLFRAYKTALSKVFVRKIRGFWIGPAAMIHLASGGNLRQNAGPKDAYSLRTDEE